MAAGRTYVDFVPSHNLVEESTKQTLVLNLPGTYMLTHLWIFSLQLASLAVLLNSWLCFY
jgi:hypothetical protein